MPGKKTKKGKATKYVVATVHSKKYRATPDQKQKKPRVYSRTNTWSQLQPAVSGTNAANIVKALAKRSLVKAGLRKIKLLTKAASRQAAYKPIKKEEKKKN